MAEIHPIPSKTPAFHDLTGKSFGRLQVIGFAGFKRRAMWHCACECGVCRLVAGEKLLSGHTRSCGCIRLERVTTHARSSTTEYKSWLSMKNRCNRHPCYAGRGIKVCQRWLDSFENFLADMGPKPSTKHSIERIDNDGNYEPGNCRWATRRDQSLNTRRTRMLTLRGRTQCLKDWAREFGINPQTVRSRLKKGVSLADALSLGGNH